MRMFRAGSTSFGLLLWCILLMPASAQASDAQPCDQTVIDKVAAELGQSGWLVPDDSSEENRLIDAACKPWPDDPDQIALALAYRLDDDETSPGERNLRLVVARWDRNSERLLMKYQEDIGEDAMTEVSEGSLRLDTARYWLTPDVRAFGFVLRSTARGASCPDAGADELMTLLVPDGQRLRPVLRTYLELWTTVSGSMCHRDGKFEGESAAQTFAVGKGTSHGFADLIVSARVTELGESDANVLRTVRKTLHYDGRRYPLEEWSGFWERGQPAR